MNRTVKLILGTALAVVAVLFIWYFSNIVFYILAAAVISMIGRPMVHFLDELNFGRFKIPHTLSALLTLMLIFVIAVSFVALIVPLIVQQAMVIGSIDSQSLTNAFREPLTFIDTTLHELRILKEGSGVQEALILKLQSVLSVATFTNALNFVVSFTGSFFMAVFSVLFISFFFLKDDTLLYNSFMLLVPVKYNDSAARILSEVKR